MGWFDNPGKKFTETYKAVERDHVEPAKKSVTQTTRYLEDSVVRPVTKELRSATKTFSDATRPLSDPFTKASEPLKKLGVETLSVVTRPAEGVMKTYGAFAKHVMGDDATAKRMNQAADQIHRTNQSVSTAVMDAAATQLTAKSITKNVATIAATAYGGAAAGAAARGFVETAQGETVTGKDMAISAVAIGAGGMAGSSTASALGPGVGGSVLSGAASGSTSNVTTTVLSTVSESNRKLTWNQTRDAALSGAVTGGVSGAVNHATQPVAPAAGRAPETSIAEAVGKSTLSGAAVSGAADMMNQYQQTGKVDLALTVEAMGRGAGSGAVDSLIDKVTMRTLPSRKTPFDNDEGPKEEERISHALNNETEYDGADCAKVDNNWATLTEDNKSTSDGEPLSTPFINKQPGTGETLTQSTLPIAFGQVELQQKLPQELQEPTSSALLNDANKSGLEKATSAATKYAKAGAKKTVAQWIDAKAEPMPAEIKLTKAQRREANRTGEKRYQLKERLLAEEKQAVTQRNAQSKSYQTNAVKGTLLAVSCAANPNECEQTLKQTAIEESTTKLLEKSLPNPSQAPLSQMRKGGIKLAGKVGVAASMMSADPNKAADSVATSIVEVAAETGAMVLGASAAKATTAAIGAGLLVGNDSIGLAPHEKQGISLQQWQANQQRIEVARQQELEQSLRDPNHSIKKLSQAIEYQQECSKHDAVIRNPRP